MFIFVSIIIILVAMGIYYGLLWLMRKRSATMVDGLDIRQHKRNSQIVDVREAAEFRAGHILGARNIPMSEFKLRSQEIRKDQSVYLYDDNLSQASRAANILHKQGHPAIFILKNGFSAWDGKTKRDLT